MVCAADTSAPGEKQTLWMAEALSAAGHETMISLAPERDGESEPAPGTRLHRHEFRLGSVRPLDRRTARGFAPDLIHARSSRAPAIRAAAAYRQETSAPVFVHWLDDEWGPLAGVPAADRREATKFAIRRELIARLDPTYWNFSTRASLAWVTEHAVGHDALIPALASEVVDRIGRHCVVIPPASTPAAWGAAGHREGMTLRQRFPEHRTLLFTGDINFGTIEDVRLAIEATARVQRAGHDVALVHVGRNTANLDLHRAATASGMDTETIHEIGAMPFDELQPLLREADVLLQPGLSTRFNRLRLPSKLQGYLASGTPTITFAFGAGELLEDGVEALLTHSDSADELAEQIVIAVSDDVVGARLAEGGPAAARRLFDPSTNAELLVDHYRNVLEAGPNG